MKKIVFAALAGFVALGAGLNLFAMVRGEGVSTSTTPLFERRLQEMNSRFEVTPATAAHGPSQTREGRMAPAQQQLGILWVSEAASVCAASGCVLSYCGGSGCGASACAGSACGISGCPGSACDMCNKPAAPEQGIAMAGGQSYCPLGGSHGPGAARITGFEAAPTEHGTEIRFAASGSEVVRYRVSRLKGERESVLLAEGPASDGRLIRVVDRLPGGAGVSYYTIEVIDTSGRATRAGDPRRRGG